MNRRLPFREKDIENAGDRLMAALGFTIWRLSQARPTRQSLGLPDRKYCDRERGVACWWEAKRETGRGHGQSPAQRDFQLDVEACGEFYVVGALDALEGWCIAQRIATRLPCGALNGVRRSEWMAGRSA